MHLQENLIEVEKKDILHSLTFARFHSLMYARLNFSKLGKDDSFLYTELTFKNQNLNVKSASSFNPSILDTVTHHDLLCNRLYKRHIIYGLVTQ